MNIDEIVALLHRTREITLRLLEQFPKDKGDFRPRGELRSAMQIIIHIALSEDRLTRGLFSNRWDVEEVQPPLIDRIEGAIAYLQKTRETTLAWLEKADNSALNQRVKTPRGREGSIAYFLLSLNEHEAHHRGQLTVYARLCGAKLHNLYS